VRPPRSPLRLTALELPARFGDPDAQLALVEATLQRRPPGDLTLLAEACLTGYVSPSLDFDLRRFAEPLEGPTARRLAHLAQRFGTHLVGPLIEAAHGATHNAMVGYTPEGTPWLHYRKRHPWFPETWATAGVAPPPVVRVREWSVTLAICFDLHFLEEDAARQLGAADVLLFPSAWVQDEDSRSARLAALARRFGLAVVNANWAPGDVRVPGQGRSMVLDATGEVRAEARPRAASADAARLDVELP
jgi:predicted amidohydrolase